MTEPALFPRPGCACTGTPSLDCFVCRGHAPALNGWHCSRPDGHEGPCTLRPEGPWLTPAEVVDQIADRMTIKSGEVPEMFRAQGDGR